MSLFYKKYNNVKNITFTNGENITQLHYLKQNILPKAIVVYIVKLVYKGHQVDKVLWIVLIEKNRGI